MFTNRSWIRLSLLLFLATLALSACRNSAEDLPEVPPVPGMSLSLTGDVCPSLEVSAGDQITWTNQSQQPGQIIGQAPDLGPLFDSGVLNRGDSFSFTFPEAGTYAYTCWIGQDAPATITVLP